MFSIPVSSELVVGTPEWFNKAIEIIEYTEKSLPDWRVTVGQEFIKVRESLPYGEFGKWIEKNIKKSRRSVYYYIECAEKPVVQSIAQPPEPLPDKGSEHSSVYRSAEEVSNNSRILPLPTAKQAMERVERGETKAQKPGSSLANISFTVPVEDKALAEEYLKGFEEPIKLTDQMRELFSQWLHDVGLKS
ncbi:DUF3102 domain-containing protein [Fischerella sp. PCC 9605]|uniref:DUF3102 domain-containing protein n=1 Tax=Fischerella sp. PCC 9605 TaxID=1173024 RepID=UPI00047AE1DF|nr:DUF3102 domain-containing protein [Fischerella sp. PCC 9605]